ncbi:MAG: hypothetical protein Q8914_00440 [Bacteroidota bacterium]|nr:hypothetical protein [Bacteroidota bacterium]
MNQRRLALYMLFFLGLPVLATAKPETSGFRDIYPDTWVATDALGRIMPGIEQAGSLKPDKQRIVGIFYVTWHSDQLAKLKTAGYKNVTDILKKNPDARFDGKSKDWENGGGYYHWGEPENGYFLSRDPYVIRKDLSMLSDAGVDVLIMDATNAVEYWDEWTSVFDVMEQMKTEGNKVPAFCFWAFNGNVITVVQDIYDRIYKASQYKDLWFYWKGKPLLLYNATPFFDANSNAIKHPNRHFEADAVTNRTNPHYGDPDYTEPYYKDYSKEVKQFFTLRNMWWGYYQWGGSRFVGTEGNWSFGYDLSDERVRNLPVVDLVSTCNGVREEAAVTAAQHPITMIGKSWTRKGGEPLLNQYDLPQPAGTTSGNSTQYGLYFQERWDEALQADPQFIYVNDWNEWTAGMFFPDKETDSVTFMGRKSNYFFVDQYNSEFNRTIQPMKDGYTDNYYMQLAQNIRRYKGVRPVPVNQGYHPVTIDGRFSDWDVLTTEYRDTKGDVAHRDYDGYAGLHYSDQSGRNDFLTSKVAVDKKNIYFYMETANDISPCTGKNWMLLFIDTDHNSATGWYGYDYVLNLKVVDAKTTVLMAYVSSPAGGNWVERCRVKYRKKGNKIEAAIPRNVLDLMSSEFIIDFKWSDNAEELKDPVSFCTGGDAAPNRRFNYRFIWKKPEHSF